MPKPHRQQGQGPYFAVSPWQDKQGGDEQQQPAGAGYGEVELPLVVAAGSAGSGAGSLAPAGNSAALADAMAIDAPPEGSPQAADVVRTQPPAAAAGPVAAVAAAAAASGGSGWVAKKRRKPSEEGQTPAVGTGAGSDGAACPLPARGTSAGAGADDDLDGAAAQGQGLQQGQVEVEGTAYLALLPSGSITGHLVCSPSIFSPARRRRSLGLMGEVVVAGRECTRDADWGVLRMTLVNFAAAAATAAREVSFLVERTEGDAMHLRAPVPWQGIELEQLPQLDTTCTSTSGLRLDFRCQQLLSGPAGDAVLSRLQPSLAGRGALLNVGEMRLDLPPEAAEALGLAAPPSAAAAPLPRPGRVPMAAGALAAAVGQDPGDGGSGTAAGTPPLLQQAVPRMYTGAGSGSGRLVQDSGDDW